MSRSADHRAWGLAAVALGLSLLLILALYHTTTLYLGGLWLQWAWEGMGDYGHGPLVVLMSAYMIYTKREVLAHLAPCPSLGALVAVIAFSLLWIIAELASVQLLQPAMILMLVISVVWALLGRRIAMALLLPVMFIGFALPGWELLLPTLQVITAESAYWLTRAAAIPAYMEDFMVTLPSGRISIAPACSGLRYLLAGVTLGVFYGYLYYSKPSQRLVVVLMIASAAILANILRVFIVIYFAWQTNMQHPYVEDHVYLGWYLFGGLMLLLLVIDHFVSARTSPQESTSEAVDYERGGNCGYSQSQRLVVYLATAALIALGPATVWYVSGEAHADREWATELPVGMGDWQGPVASNDTWMPVYHGAIPQRGVYRRRDTAVYLYTGYYPRQTHGAELVNELNSIPVNYNYISVNSISDGNDWRVMRSVEYQSEQLDDPVMEAELVTITGRKRLVWYRYHVAGRYTTGAYRTKLLQVAGLLTGRPASAVIAMATDIDNDVQTARAQLADFMHTMEQPLARTFEGKGSGE